MEWRHTALAALALGALVFVSSYFGLSGRWFWDVGDALGFMGGIWADSALADAAFTGGTVGASLLGWRLARRSVLLSVAAGALAHYAVYLTSFYLLDVSRQDLGAMPLEDGAWFVLTWGFVGLAIAAVAPPLAYRQWTAREARGEGTMRADAA